MALNGCRELNSIVPLYSLSSPSLPSVVSEPVQRVRLIIGQDF